MRKYNMPKPSANKKKPPAKEAKNGQPNQAQQPGNTSGGGGQ